MTQEQILDEAQRCEDENYEWIDDAFRVEETRFMWKSVRKDTGKDFLFGMTEKIVTDMSRWHLKCEQEGWTQKDLYVSLTMV